MEAAGAMQAFPWHTVPAHISLSLPPDVVIQDVSDDEDGQNPTPQNITSSSSNCRITTVPLTVIPGGTFIFNYVNPLIHAGSHLYHHIEHYTGTHGIPRVMLGVGQGGTVQVRVENHGATPLDGALSFRVLVL